MSLERTTEANSVGEPAEAPLLSHTIGQLDRAIRHQLREILRPFQLSILEFAVLSALKRCPGQSNAQLARHAFILPQSMIQVISNLEQRQLVERAPDPSHNRVLRTKLTTIGKTVIDAAESETVAFEDRILRSAGTADDLDRVVVVLQGWAEAMRSHKPDAGQRSSGGGARGG